MTRLVRWDTGELIHEHDGDIRATVEAAAKLGISCLRADLDGASLDGASLVGASLVGARLDGASLVGARLDGASLDRARLPIWCRWCVSYSIEPSVVVHIGCKSKSVEEWDAWFAGAGEFDTPRDSEDFRRIRANYLAVKAYLIAMQEGAAQ